MSIRSQRRAFTLIELLVISAIIGVLVGLALPAVQRARDAGYRAVCQDHLKQIGLALHQYHDAHLSLPPGVSFQREKEPYPHMSWCTRLLPYVEHDALWKETLRAYAVEPFFRKNPPHVGLSTVVPLFTCSSDPRVRSANDLGGYEIAFTSYVGVAGIDFGSYDGLLYLNSRVRLSEITDGASNTLLVGERPPSADLRFGWWYAGWGQSKDGSAEMLMGIQELNVTTDPEECPIGPYEFSAGSLSNPCDTFHFWSPHTGGGAHFLSADGAVRFVRYTASAIMPALATRSGAEYISVME
jgi:prepilin-type N-terminal cleavage/methylation domain-containing protein